MNTYANTTSNRTLSAFFRDRADAERAIERLASAGIIRNNIRLVPGQEDQTVVSGTDARQHTGFWDALSDFFFPDEDRSVYAEGLRRGGYLVTVTGITEAQHDAALDILDDDGTIDIDEWSDSWRSEGWSATNPGFDRTSSSSALHSTEDAFATSTRATGDGEAIPVVEEHLKVGKRDVNNGRVRVRSYVVETPVSEAVTLRDENVSVERRSVDRPLTDADRAFQDRTIEAEEHREEAVVAKEARVKEEVVVRKTESQRTEKIEDKVRHTEVEVEDDRTDGRIGNAPFQGQTQRSTPGQYQR